MDKRKPTRAESAIIAVIAVLIITIVKFSNQLVEYNLLLPLVAVVFIGVFGFFGFQAMKLWKQSDEEILDIETPDRNATPSEPAKKQPTYEDRKKYFFSCIAFIAFVLFQQDRLSPPPLIFCGIVLTIACVCFLPALIQKFRGRENEPLFANTKLRPEHFVFMLFGLFGVGFCGFFCFLVITKLPLKFSIPFLFPPLIIGSAFARPLVAGIRILLKSGKHKENDPWDRPDRKL